MYQLLITVACKAPVQSALLAEFGTQYNIVFAQEDQNVIARELPTADVVIGEPDPKLLAAAKNLKWMQITWAGADRYTGNFPEGVILTNASGAFGRIISEYTMGMILSVYNGFLNIMSTKRRKSGQILAVRRVCWASVP